MTIDVNRQIRRASLDLRKAARELSETRDDTDLAEVQGNVNSLIDSVGELVTVLKDPNYIPKAVHLELEGLRRRALKRGLTPGEQAEVAAGIKRLEARVTSA